METIEEGMIDRQQNEFEINSSLEFESNSTLTPCDVYLQKVNNSLGIYNIIVMYKV